MKQQKSLPVPACLVRHLFTAVAATFSLFLSTPGFAQATYVAPYSFPDNVKQYSTVLVPSGHQAGSYQNEESVMAGTIYGAFAGGGTNDIHFLHMDGDGSILYSTQITDNHGDYDDTRVVSVAAHVEGVHDYYYITCLARRNQHIGAPTSADRDAIKVVKVDSTGTVVDQIIIENTATGMTTSGSSIYPLHSIIASNDKLYICGYLTSEETIAPAEPNFNTDKEAFVLSIDADASFSSNTPSIVTINYTDKNVYDYDIAMRMVEIKHGPYTGHIHVTGSCNAKQDYNAPSYVFYRSATMNLVVDASTLSVKVDKPFMEHGQPESDGTPSEYGISMYEDAGNDDYIVTNLFENSDHGSTFAMNPMSFVVTRIDYDDFDPDNTRSLNLNGGAIWAVHTLPSYNTLVPASGNQNDVFRFLIVGMASSYGNCTPPVDFTTYNINPFLMDVNADWTPVNANYEVETDPGDFHVYTMNTTNGTSNATLYPAVGGDLSNIYWNSVIADRRGTNNGDEVVMNAPKVSNGSLGLKWLNPKYDDLDLNVGCGHDNNCDPSFYPQDNDQRNPGSSNSVGLTTSSPTYSATSYSAPSLYICTDPSSNPDWKPSSVAVVAKSNATEIYPNPANDELHIALAKNIKGTSAIRACLMDMMGRIVSTLYDGPASGLTPATKLSPGHVADGIYFVQLFADNKPVYRQKVNIER